MGYWLDYSAAKLTAQQVLGAGHSGVIRYIDSPERLGKKHTSRAEYADFVRNKVPVLLVFEVNINDADGGWNQGVAYAKRAKAGADYLGYSGPIFFCNDKTGVSDPAAWRAYLDGAASILGKNRIGAYGFYNAMDTALGHATYFWQSGRRSDVRPHVHIWQDNNVQVTVAGITCDRNLMIKEVNSDMALSDEDKTWIRRQLRDSAAGAPAEGAVEQLNGWWYAPRFRGGENYAQVALKAAQDAADAKAGIQAANASITGLIAAVAALSKDSNLNVELVKKIIQDAVKQSLHITGTVQISGE